jgi:O-antigen ligase
MAYPFWTIVQNVSFFFIIAFYITSSRFYNNLFRVGSLISIAACFLMLGAVISTIASGFNQDFSNFSFSLSVLPNYLYWGVLIILLGNTVFKIVTPEQLYKVFFFATAASTITYFFLHPIFDIIPFYRTISPNNYAFVLIIFAPMCTAYVQQRYKNPVVTLLLILVITLCGFLSGSRSASILAGMGGLLVLAINSWLRIIIISFVGLFVYIAAPQILESPEVKQTVFNLNERTYDLIYKTDETFATDRSYLTRVAMIEKGVKLFQSSPVVGIGIGNFQRTQQDIDFDFEGGEFLESKYESLETAISAHNSYISFLSEGGVLLFIPMIFLMFYPLFYFVLNFNAIPYSDKAIFISILFMCIHAWFIVGMVNVYGWFIIGIANSYIIYRKAIYRS